MKKVKLLFSFLIFFLLLHPNNVEGKEEVYSFEQMERDLFLLKSEFSFDLQSIGKSEKGRNLWAVKLGKGNESILLIGAHHGREWLTSKLLLKMLQEYAQAYKKGNNIGKYSPKLLDKVSIWFIPMINPDGVSIQQEDFTGLSSYEKFSVWKMNHFYWDWSRWKANAKGLDLNRQYPAGWDEVKIESSSPSYQFYKGKKPFEALEVQQLAKFTRKIHPLIALSYHTSGREIFWYYYNRPVHFWRDYQLAQKTALLTGYKLSIPEDHAIGSGFTDWFITEFHRPAMTIELSYLVEETHPPLTVFPEEWRRNQYVAMMLVHEGIKMKDCKEIPHTKQ